MTQTEMILEYMSKYGSISALEAANAFSCMRLAARIADLKADGVPIRKEMVNGKNKAGGACRFARYSLEDVDAE